MVSMIHDVARGRRYRVTACHPVSIVRNADGMNCSFNLEIVMNIQAVVLNNGNVAVCDEWTTVLFAISTAAKNPHVVASCYSMESDTGILTTFHVESTIPYKCKHETGEESLYEAILAELDRLMRRIMMNRVDEDAWVVALREVYNRYL